MSDQDYNYVERVPDAGLPRQRRSALSRVVGGLFGWSLLAGLIVAAALGWGWMQFTATGPLQDPKIVNLEPGTGRNEIAQKLATEGVIADPRILSVASIAAELRGATVKPGEYQFPARATTADVLDILLSGRVLTYKLTIPEGWTSDMAVARINDNDVLTGDAVVAPPEGTLIADTQVFRRGTTRSKILQDMQGDQTKLVDELWARRPADTILKSKDEMVTLASIVEKETAKADERPKIAGVFLNRLKQKIRLQSDPTIIYGLIGGKGKLDRALTRDDIDSKTAYNTYQIDGLPPGPIATPGRAALEAVIAPTDTKDLYFVADGTGGHAFAATLEAHNANVKKWRAAQKNGILLPEGNNGTVSPDPTKIVPEVEQPPLPPVEDPAAAQLTPAVDDAAVAEAAATKQSTLEVPAPNEGSATQGLETKPVAAEPPPLPATKPKVVTGVESEPPPEAAAPADTAKPDETQVAAKPGTVIKLGTQLVPIPRFKPPKP